MHKKLVLVCATFLLTLVGGCSIIKMSQGTSTLTTAYRKGDLIMEKIKVFTGMEVHGTVEMVVLKTLKNGTKLCWFDHDNDSTEESWDELWIAQDTPFDREYGDTKWYGIDSKNVIVDLDGETYVKEFKAKFIG